MSASERLSPWLGMRLREAEPLLRASGVPYTVVRTEPDWKKDPVRGPLRIIRVRELPLRTGSDDAAASAEGSVHPGNEAAAESVLELVCCPVPDPFEREKERSLTEAPSCPPEGK